MQLQSKSEEINHEMPSLLNQEEFREGGEIQIGAAGKVAISQQPGISLCSLLSC